MPAFEETPILKNPYDFHREDVSEPPTGFRNVLKRIGPGMILAASIVGSGELIATTTLGAEIGYTALWIILLSCLIKPAVQAELGRYTIATGETALEGFNRLPGPKWRVNWSIWAWFLMMFMTLLQIGAMYGGVAQVANILAPAVPVGAWVLVFMVITLAVLLGGGYERVEFGAMVMVALFTMLTLLTAMVLIAEPRFFSVRQAVDGLKLKLPEAGLASGVAVFGITGVGASELFMYPYWCVEKGYARFVGRQDGTVGWVRRVHGWVRVMFVDIYASMIIYTISTVGFYLLGAGVLHSMGLVPRAADMIAVLSNMFTQVLGPWAAPLFYAGAVAVLYSTIFAATASNSRVYADMASLLGLFPRDDYTARLRLQRTITVIITLIPVGLYYSFQSPVLMVKAGGVGQAAMLPVIAFGALYLRHRHLPKVLRPSRLVTFLFWFASGVIIALMGYYTYLVAAR